MSLITGKTLSRVQSYFFENFNPLDQKLPNGICGLCRNLLLRVELPDNDTKKIKVEQLPDVTDFSKLNFPVPTRSSGSLTLGEMKNCLCDLCKIASENVASFGSRSSGHGFAKPQNLGRPPMIGPPKLCTPKPIKVCSRCMQVVGKGIFHPQNCTISDRRLNLHELSLEDPRGRELEAGKVYK